MFRTIGITLSILAAFASGMGYDKEIASIFERIPTIITAILHAFLAIGVLMAVVQNDGNRWFR